MTSKQAIDIFKEKYPHKKPIGYWIDGENVILNTSPSLGLGYSEVCQYIVFADVHPHHLVLVILKSASTLCLQMARSSLLTLCAVK